MIKTMLKLLAIVLVLSGCAPAAMTPDEFREQVRRNYPQEHETYVVNRTAEQVGSTFRRKAKECLNFDIQAVSKGLNYGETWTQFSSKSYVNKSGGKYVLIMQTIMEGAVAKGPKDGYYVLVVDATPINTNKTRVDVYTGMSAVFKQAILSWANGVERGCPDQMRMYER